MTFDTEAFARQLDALTLAGQDNMARALREVEMITAFRHSEEIVQGHLMDLQKSLQRTNDLKAQTAAMLGHHRMPRRSTIRSNTDAVTQAVEAHRKAIGR
jgi:hypothetical protein